MKGCRDREEVESEKDGVERKTVMREVVVHDSDYAGFLVLFPLIFFISKTFRLACQTVEK